MADSGMNHITCSVLGCLGCPGTAGMDKFCAIEFRDIEEPIVRGYRPEWCPLKTQMTTMKVKLQGVDYGEAASAN